MEKRKFFTPTATVEKLQWHHHFTDKNELRRIIGNTGITNVVEELKFRYDHPVRFWGPQYRIAHSVISEMLIEQLGDDSAAPIINDLNSRQASSFEYAKFTRGWRVPYDGTDLQDLAAPQPTPQPEEPASIIYARYAVMPPMGHVLKVDVNPEIL